MAEYKYRLRFHLPEHHTIGWDDAELEIPTGDDLEHLRLTLDHGTGPIKSARWLVLEGGPFNTLEDAETAGKRARRSLMQYSIRFHVGIDLGKDKSTGGMFKGFKDKIYDKTSVRVLDEVHGLQVYESTGNVSFVNCSASAVLGNQVSNFLEMFLPANTDKFQPNPKQELAIELYSASQFELSVRNRFLTLVMAVEALLEPKDRPQDVKRYVNSFVDHIEQSCLPTNEKQSIVRSLNWLYQDSIGRTGKLLAERLLKGKKYNIKSPCIFFRDCYSLRSQLVHYGKFSDKTVDIGHIVSELSRFVSDLLVASCCGL